MKIISRTFTLFITTLIFPLFLFGQGKSITSEAYNSALNEAEVKTEKQIRKIVSIQKLFTNGELTGTLTDTTEYLPPDKLRWIAVEDMGQGVKRTEVIQIGGFKYRKEDNGEWIKQDVDDDNYGIPIGIDNSTKEYFIEESMNGEEKFQILIEKRINGSRTNFDENKVWINKKGLIVKKTSTSSFKEPQNIVSSIDVTYDYNLSPPKIEAPIK